jgi:hypothetical protein
MSDDPVADLMARIDKERSTPEGRAALDEKILKWRDEEQLRKGSIRAAELDILAVCEKHFPKGGNDLDAPSMLAASLDYFTLGDSENNPVQLYLEWAVEELAGRKLMAGLDGIRAIYNTLVERGCDSEAKSHEWNDCDNTLFYIPHDTKQIWCATGQTTRYMFIMDDRRFHVRRYWDTVAPTDDKWDIQDRAKYNRKGFEYAVQMADWLTENWSDNLLDNRYVRRPDRQWWADKDYEPQYGDCRDDGYVLSMDISPDAYRHRVDRAIYFIQDIKLAFFEIQCALGTLDI